MFCEIECILWRCVWLINCCNNQFLIWKRRSSFVGDSFQKIGDGRAPTTIHLKQNSLVSGICQLRNQRKQPSEKCKPVHILIQLGSIQCCLGMGLTVTTQHQESLWQRREASSPDTWCVEGWRVKVALCTESSSSMLFLLKKILVKQNLKGNIQLPRG